MQYLMNVATYFTRKLGCTITQKGVNVDCTVVHHPKFGYISA